MQYDYLRDRTVLVTGATGSVGSVLVRHLVGSGVRAVRAFDHDESGLFVLTKQLAGDGVVGPLVGDIRDLDRLRFALDGVDVVFHTAALKHVELGEYNPFEVVQTNLVGLNNVIRAAIDVTAERVVFTSSDKAVSPTNVLGASKLMGERLVTAANRITGPRPTRFASVRFGNVAGSRGSVVPLFMAQIRAGGPVELTDAGMTRYLMTVEEAARLILEAGALMRGGEVFVTKMRAVRIEDLARALIDELSPERPVEIQEIGPRPGEKMYEELVAPDELPRTLETDDLLIVLPPEEAGIDVDLAAHYRDIAKPASRLWHSAEEVPMPLDELRAYLRDNRILEPSL